MFNWSYNGHILFYWSLIDIYFSSIQAKKGSLLCPIEVIIDTSLCPVKAKRTYFILTNFDCVQSKPKGCNIVFFIDLSRTASALYTVYNCVQLKLKCSNCVAACIQITHENDMLQYSKEQLLWNETIFASQENCEFWRETKKNCHNYKFHSSNKIFLHLITCIIKMTICPHLYL